MANRNHHKTMVLSDIHLGSKNSKISELLSFLKYNTCDMLILNGDIIDGWKLRNGTKWKKKYTRFFRVLLKMVEKRKTEVVYVRGNHDDFLDHIIPFIYADFWVVRTHIHYSKGKRYLVLHGDVFDPVSNNLRWLTKLGIANYSFSLWINKIYNYFRTHIGLPHFSLSHTIQKHELKGKEHIFNYERELVKLARKKNCDGVICGHIHCPAIKQYEDVTYMNSGDWVDSMSALVEDYKGNWEIVNYSEEK
ncbi:MAG TPA: UDP-2,3-diacylglucosamine diphosphatase [Bacteroidales bacterium]